jgi:hypothetical protein
MNDARKVAVSRFWMNFTPWHREFLKEVAEKYKERGRFPFIPIRELAMCYEDKRDKEVAALAGLMIKDDEKAEQRVREFRVMMGESPWRWFERRYFALLSTGARQEERIGGVAGWKIAAFYSALFRMCDMGGSNLISIGVEFADLDSGDIAAILQASTMQSSLELSFEKLETRIRLLRLVFGTSDGIGIGQWSIYPHELKCPDSDEIRAFVKTWLPELSKRGKYSCLFTFDGAVRMYGFERDCDFFYAWLGWKELCRRKPKECSRYVTLYQKRYDEGNLLEERYWTGERYGIVPEVDF